MFTGIIKEKAKAKDITKKDGSIFVVVETPKPFKLKLGESISINGICSTVRKINKKDFIVEYMKETIDKTTVSIWNKGDVLNLERSLKMSDLMDGHIVSGHVDTVGKIKEARFDEATLFLKIEIPKEFTKYIISKGSVTLNGVSMTVINPKVNTFGVAVVNYTQEHTNLGTLKEGDSVNVEVDVLAKYVARLLNIK